MTILQSLKKLHKKMTGQETTSKTIGGILDSMQENYASGSGGDADLPEPGAVGNVLTSTGTGWESAAPADNEMTITADLDVSDFSISNFSEDRFSRIESAFLAGKSVRLIVNVFDEPTLNAHLAFRNDDVLIFVTETMLDDDDYRYAFWVVVDPGEGEQLVGAPYIYNHLPVVSGSDNGKVLGVENGEYALKSTSFIIHIGAYDNVMFTQETVQDIINAYTNSIPIEAYMEPIAFADYQGTTIKYQIEKIYCTDPKSESNPYKIVFSCYDENEVTKRKYITMESTSPVTNYGVTLT